MLYIYMIIKYIKNKIKILINTIQKSHFYRRFLINVSFLMISNVCVSLLLFIQGIILARNLGVTNYGTLTLVTTYVNIINLFVNLRLIEMVISGLNEYWKCDNKEKAVSFIKFCFFINAICGIVAMIICLC